MRSIDRSWTTPGLAVVAITLTALTACGAHDDAKPAPTASTDQTSQPTVPPPLGDSTPKPADSQAASASPGTESASRAPGAQSTVGTAAAGAPPYTLNGAPEGNKAPESGEPAKK